MSIIRSFSSKFYHNSHPIFNRFCNSSFVSGCFLFSTATALLTRSYNNMSYLAAAATSSSPTSSASAEQIQTLKNNVIDFQQLKRENFAQIARAVGNARVVLIGEATHGTEEFYRTRAEITKALIEHHGFDFVAVEADWPDAYRCNRYVKLQSKDNNVKDTLGDFVRFPKWMWRNHAVMDFLEWLREYNRTHGNKVEGETQQQQNHPLVGFYGLDLYSLYRSSELVINYLEEIDPPRAEECRERYGTLNLFQDEPSEYGMSVEMGMVESQEKKVTDQLVEILKREAEYIQASGGWADPKEEYFYTAQNARLVKDAEKYYRNSMRGGTVTWNIRDGHMTETLKGLLDFYTELKGGTVERNPQDPLQPKMGRAVVWAHNSHIGDASATQYGAEKERNIGQMTRRLLGLHNTFNIGFTTHIGSVSAARRWGGARETMSVNPSLAQSYEHIFHSVSESLRDTGRTPDFSILLRSNNPEVKPNTSVLDILARPRVQRFIGVQYVKATEFQSHYIKCNIPKQYDFLNHIDETHALQAFREDDDIEEERAKKRRARG